MRHLRAKKYFTMTIFPQNQSSHPNTRCLTGYIPPERVGHVLLQKDKQRDKPFSQRNEDACLGKHTRETKGIQKNKLPKHANGSTIKPPKKHVCIPWQVVRSPVCTPGNATQGNRKHQLPPHNQNYLNSNKASVHIGADEKISEMITFERKK